MENSNKENLPGNSQSIIINVNGIPTKAIAGESLSCVFYANGWKKWHRTPYGAEQGLFCGIGHCFGCLVTVDGVPNIRACQTLVSEGMDIVTDIILEGKS